MEDREGKMRSVLSAVCKPIDLHKRRCEKHLCPRVWSSLALCVCVCRSVFCASAIACICLTVFVCAWNNRGDIWRTVSAMGAQLCTHKPILLSILSDPCFLCHVKTVTGVSPKAKTLYHCLPLYLSALIYCCSSLVRSGNIAVNLVPTLRLCHSPSPCSPCR